MLDLSLIELAKAARERAYAPYSKFLVGAALKDDRGQMFAGCNIENAAYPQGQCAEASAIAAMVLAGGKKISQIVVVGAGEEPVTPCGGCRQKIREFADPTCHIIICDQVGNVKLQTTLSELLPHSFGPNHLEAKK